MLVWRSAEKLSLGRPKRKLNLANKMDLRKSYFEGGRWVKLAQVRVRWRVLVLAMSKLWIPQQGSQMFG
jgi:hypothetical protein